MNILEKIINDKKKEVKLDKIKNPIDQLKKKVSNKKYIFSNTLENYKQENKIAIIAEIKKASPSKGIIKEDFDHLKIAEEYIKNNAACLSVLTEKKYFLGNKKFVRDIKKKFNTPVLNKDFFIDPYQVIEANQNGSDCILVIINSSDETLINELISTADELGMNSILEVHSEKEMEIALNFKNALFGINNRNLENFSVSLDTTINIYKEFESALKNKIVISESGFHSNEEIKKVKNETGINNFLIGESLIKSDSITECFQNFIK
ncbi:MAG: indole-3-glycerol phosphate synthase TrpC [Pelagibacteraceae bacterium]